MDIAGLSSNNCILYSIGDSFGCLYLFVDFVSKDYNPDYTWKCMLLYYSYRNYSKLNDGNFKRYI